MPSTKTGFPSWSFVQRLNSDDTPTLTGSVGNVSSEASRSTALSGCSHRARRPPGVSPLLSMKSVRNTCSLDVVTTGMSPLRILLIVWISTIRPRLST